MPDQSNPFYFLVAKQNPRLKHKMSREGKRPYYLVNLDSKPSTELVLNGEKYKHVEHHLSVFKEYNESKEVFSPIHYTAVYQHVTNKTEVLMHIYYDEGCNFIHYNLQNNDIAKTPFEKEGDKKFTSVLQNLAYLNAQSTLDSLSNDLQTQLKQYNETKKRIITQLDTLSTTEDLHCQKYQQSVRDAIAELEAYNQFIFHPDYSTQRIFKNYLKLAKPNKEHQQKQAIPLATKKSAEEAVSSPIEERTTLNPTVIKKSTSIKAAIALLQTEEITKSLKISKNLLLSEACLYAELEETTDFAIQLSLYRKLDAINQFRWNIMAQACIDNDEVTLKTHFQKLDRNDSPFISVLLSTCVAYNRPELFDYLYKKTKSNYVKHTVCAPPAVCTVIPYSLLEIAYRENNLIFFRNLLQQYKYDPNSLANIDTSILIHAIHSKKNDFVQALLEAGVNTDEVQSGCAIQSCTYNKAAGSLIPTRQINLESDSFTPLERAIHTPNDDALLLLLKYKVNSLKKRSDKKTLLGIYYLSLKTEEPNKTIIQAFLKNGHHIDEPQLPCGVTMLDYCLQKEKPRMYIKILLEFGANPNKLSPEGQAAYQLYISNENVNVHTQGDLGLFKKSDEVKANESPTVVVSDQPKV